MHQHPGLCVEERVMSAFLPVDHAIFHLQEICEIQPNRRGKYFSQRLQTRVGGWLGRNGERGRKRRRKGKLWITSQFGFLGREVEGSEVFGESFIEPGLRGRVVVGEVVVRHGMLDSPPAIGNGGVKDDVYPVIARRKNPLRNTGVCTCSRRDLSVGGRI